MLDIRHLRETYDEAEAALKRRDPAISLALVRGLDQDVRAIKARKEERQARRNTLNQEIGRSRGNAPPDLLREVAGLKESIKADEALLEEKSAELRDMLLNLPNRPHSTVPDGKTSEDNRELRRWGDSPAFSFPPQPHWEIGESLEILDFERGSQIAGARFSVSRGAGALLERALINFMLDLHTREHGYREILPPFLVNHESMMGTGQLPKFEDDLFYLRDDAYILIPTGEVPLTNLHRGEILSEDALPMGYAAYTPCFRREAGSYGKDTRGLIRQHQFNKVELVRFCGPGASYKELEILLGHAEEVLRRLNLPYRVVVLCAGDLGFSAAKTYDIEVWLPGVDAFREISSVSNFEAYQAARAGIRYRPRGTKGTEYVHTLNGSGLAVGRTVAAILENYQQEDGTVVIPEALRSYMNGMSVIEKER